MTGTLARLGGALRRAFDGDEGITDPVEVVETCVRLASRARREGLLALEDEMKDVRDPILSQGVMEVVDGTPPRVIHEELEARTVSMERRHASTIELIEEGGRLAVGLGMVGALLGVADAIAGDRGAVNRSGLAGAARLAATGLAAAHLVCRPLAARLKRRSAREASSMRLATAGVLGIQAGHTPRALRHALAAQLSPVERARLKEPGPPSRAQAAGAAGRSEAEAPHAAPPRLEIRELREYEQLARLGPNDMLRVVRTSGMDNRALALALRGSSSGVREAVLRAMSIRTAAAVSDEVEALHTRLDALGPQAQRLVTDAKQDLLAAALKVAEQERAEEAKWVPGDDEEPLAPFESLLTLTDNELRRVLRELNLSSATQLRELAVALRGVPDALRERLIASVRPEPLGERLRREIEEIGPQRRSEIAFRQRQIMETVRRLAAQSEIYPPSAEPDIDTSTYPFDEALGSEAAQRVLPRLLRDKAAANELAVVAMALRGASDNARDSVLTHASGGLRERLLDEVELVGPQRRASVERFQREMVAELERLAGG